MSMLVLTGAIILITGLGKLKTNADYRVYFDPDDPLLQTDHALAEQYDRLDSLLLILSVKTGNLLEPSLLDLYPALEDQLGDIAHVKRVSGFFQLLDDQNDIESQSDAIADNRPSEDLLRQLQAHPLGKNLISGDGRFGLLNLGVSLPGADTASELINFIAATRAAVSRHLSSSAIPVSVHYSGTLALNEAYIDVVRHDLKRFVPLLLIIFACCLFVFFRHWGLCFMLMGTALLSAAAALGAAGWLGWELAAINAFTPIIIMSLNIATSMHVVVNYIRFVAGGVNRESAITRSVHYNFQALTLSTLTTVCGFLLLSSSPSPPVQIVGYTVAIGMLISYALCLTVLRAVLPKLRLSPRQAEIIAARFSLCNLGSWTLKNRVKIIVFSISLVLLGLFAVQRLRVDDNVYEYFPEQHHFRQATQLIDSHFDGTIRLYYSLDSGASLGVLTAAYSKIVSDFTAWLRGHEIVARVDDIYSLAIGKTVQPRTLRPIFETSSPGMLGLEQLVSENYSATSVTVILKMVTASQVIAFNQQVVDWLETNIGQYHYSGGVGPDLLFARLGERNARSMFFSLGLALAMIALLTGALLRSWSAAGIGLLCNLSPVIVVFAVWSLVGGYISLGSAMVMGMILGVIVDDTLHMLLKFPRGANVSTNASIHTLFENVCPAIAITSITLAAGLSVGVFSGFRPIVELSLLSLFIILAAMLADLLLLPALMRAVHFRRV